MGFIIFAILVIAAFWGFSYSKRSAGSSSPQTKYLEDPWLTDFENKLDELDRPSREEYKKLKESNRKWSEVNAPVGDYSNKGIALEKTGEIEKAITEYEKCLEHIYENYGKGYMDRVAWHSPTRLRILYRKTKNEKEEQFLRDFIEFCDRNKIEYPVQFKNQLNRYER